MKESERRLVLLVTPGSDKLCELLANSRTGKGKSQITKTTALHAQTGSYRDLHGLQKNMKGARDSYLIHPTSNSTACTSLRLLEGSLNALTLHFQCCSLLLVPAAAP